MCKVYDDEDENNNFRAINRQYIDILFAHLLKCHLRGGPVLTVCTITAMNNSNSLYVEDISVRIVCVIKHTPVECCHKISEHRCFFKL